MKKLLMINGSMGVGKTTVCQALKHLLKPCAFLDGDWCWDMEPFQVTQENKKMVLDNIAYLLNSYLQNSAFSYVIFCWVVPAESIWEEILSHITAQDFCVYKITLLANEQTLSQRILLDAIHPRQEDTLQKSLSYLPFYSHMNTNRIHTDDKSVSEICEEIIRLLGV